MTFECGCIEMKNKFANNYDNLLTTIIILHVIYVRMSLINSQ